MYVAIGAIIGWFFMEFLWFIIKGIFNFIMLTVGMLIARPIMGLTVIAFGALSWSLSWPSYWFMAALIIAVIIYVATSSNDSVNR